MIYKPQIIYCISLHHLSFLDTLCKGAVGGGSDTLCFRVGSQHMRHYTLEVMLHLYLA